MTPQNSPTADSSKNKRSVWKPLAAAGIGGAVLIATGFGVFAQLNATATGAQAVDSGTLLLTLADNGAGFTQPITRVAPGDVVNRYVTLTNTGTLDGTALNAKVVATANNLVDATRGLQAVISTCPTAWTPTSGTCSVAPTAAYSGPVSSLISAPRTLVASPTPIANTTGKVFLQIALTLPDQAETSVNGVLPSPAGGTIQGLTNSLAWTFTETQRAAVTTNS